MDLQRRDNSFASRDRTPVVSENQLRRTEPASVLESAALRLKVPGLSIELSGNTIPQSPKSLAVSDLVQNIATLVLTCGLGVLCRWLGASLWLCLVAVGIGLTISVSRFRSRRRT
jgi:hypothetical protein